MIPLAVDLEQPIRWLVVFAAVFALDWVWAKYMRAVADRVRVTASLHAALIIGLTVVSTTSWINDWVLAIPAMAGAAAGTWYSVGRHT